MRKSNWKTINRQGKLIENAGLNIAAIADDISADFNRANVAKIIDRTLLAIEASVLAIRIALDKETLG